MRSTLSAVAFIVLCSACARAATIGVPENNVPWSFGAQWPRAQQGIYADVATTMASRSQIPLEVKFVPYGRMREGVKSGDIDYTFGVVGPTTVAAAPFTIMIAKVPMVAVARKGLSLKSLDDLHNFGAVGHNRSVSCGAAVDSDPAIHLIALDSYESAIRMMAAGRLDGWCGIGPGLTYALASLKIGDLMGDHMEYGVEKIGFQVTPAKAESAEAKALEEVLDGMVKDGTVGQIFTRYVGAPYAP